MFTVKEHLLKHNENGFSSQVLASCISDGFVNDYFLHLVSAVPKTKETLVLLCEAVLGDHEHEVKNGHGNTRGINIDVHTASDGVLKILRGILAVCTPRPKYTTCSSDVEMISKKKKGSSMKSGVTSAQPSQPSFQCPEMPVQQLVSASEWWQQQLEVFWKTAATSKQLEPTLLESLMEAEINDTQIPTADWLADAMSKLKNFKAGLREGSYTQYEKFVLDKVRRAVNFILQVTEVEALKQAGLENCMDILGVAFEFFGALPECLQWKEKTQTWYQNFKVFFLEKEFSSTLQDMVSHEKIDFVILASKFKEVDAVKFSPETRSAVYKASDLVAKAVYTEDGPLSKSSEC